MSYSQYLEYVIFHNLFHFDDIVIVILQQYYLTNIKYYQF